MAFILAFSAREDEFCARKSGPGYRVNFLPSRSLGGGDGELPFSFSLFGGETTPRLDLSAAATANSRSHSLSRSPSAAGGGSESTPCLDGMRVTGNKHPFSVLFGCEATPLLDLSQSRRQQPLHSFSFSSFSRSIDGMQASLSLSRNDRFPFNPFTDFARSDFSFLKPACLGSAPAEKQPLLAATAAQRRRTTKLY